MSEWHAHFVSCILFPTAQLFSREHRRHTRRGLGSATVTCVEYAMFMFLSDGQDNFICIKCNLVSILEEKTEGLESLVFMLCVVRKNEDFLDRHYERLALKRPKRKEEKWPRVTTRRMRFHIVPEA